MSAARERAIRERGERHGEPGHLNVVVRDQDSDATGYGAHNRLVVHGSLDGGTIYVREDLIPERPLPLSTDEQRRKVANGWRRLHPRGARLRLVSSAPYYNGRSVSIEHEYAVERTRVRT